MKKILNGMLLMITAITTSITSIILLVLLGGLVFILFTCAMMVSEVGAAEKQDLKSYGNCAVYDKLDTFDDDLSYVLTCQNREYYRSMIFFTARVEGKNLFYSVSVGNTLGYILEDKADVKIRIDRGTTFTGRWDYDYYYEDMASVMNKSLFFNDLLNQMISGNKLHFSISDDYNTERGEIPLNGSSKAIADFKQRIAHLNVIQ